MLLEWISYGFGLEHCLPLSPETLGWSSGVWKAGWISFKHAKCTHWSVHPLGNWLLRLGKSWFNESGNWNQSQVCLYTLSLLLGWESGLFIGKEVPVVKCFFLVRRWPWCLWDFSEGVSGLLSVLLWLHREFCYLGFWRHNRFTKRVFAKMFSCLVFGNWAKDGGCLSTKINIVI